MHHGYTIPGVVTGKPIAIGGSLGRNEATARGAVFTLLQWAKAKSHAARRGDGRDPGLRQRRAASPRPCSPTRARRIVAVSDSTGGIHNPPGLDPAKVSAWKQEHGTVVGFPGSDEVTQPGDPRARRATSSCPAALENQITRHNAPQHQGQGRRRGRQRPDHARGGRDPLRPRRLPDPRHPLQRRRRDGQLLRVGAGHAELLLDRGAHQREPQGDHGSRVRGACTP